MNKAEREARKTYTELGAVEFQDPRAKEYMEILYKKLVATGMGITVIGPHVALRFSSPKNPRDLVTVSLSVVDIHDTGVFELEDDK